MDGFHGGIRAFINDLLRTKKNDGYQNFINETKVLFGLLETESEEMTLNTFKHYENVAEEEEDAFFLKLGMSPILFERSQRQDKGVEDIGDCHVMLYPKSETFKKYGFNNIKGDQSLVMIKLDPSNIYYADYGCPALID